MNKTVDERVVEMRFDNRQFEAGVQTSLSTLNKLKKGLDLDGAAKGFDQLGAAVKRCDMSLLGRSVATVQAKFSAFEVVAITALSNITNSAVNAGKRIAAAFTIDPIKSGFQEYETQINAVQTILANTSSKGTSLEQVNNALDELNRYADKTIYNFTEMTRNIGTFTAAGVDLDTSVAAIKGIANLAAVSGSTSQQASTAMYQLSQALSAGTVKLQDWNSVVNAGMGGQVFQDALKDTARIHGIAIDSMIEKEGSFRETLSNGWLSSDILTETLEKFTGDLSRAQLLEQGYSEEQTKAILEMGETANDAATKVKTFTQLMDTLKEAAQSGWTETWEIVVGDFEEAKKLFTTVSDGLGAIISESAEGRNSLLQGAFMSSWGQLKNDVVETGFSVTAFRDALQETASESVSGLDKMIEEAGSFEDTLSKGWLTTDILAKALDDMANKATGTTGGIAALSDEQFKNIGMTEEQIESFRSLSAQASSSSGKMAELVNTMTRKSGRELLFDSLVNVAKAVQSVLGAVKSAWREIFPPATSEQLYSFIEALHSASEKIRDFFTQAEAGADGFTEAVNKPLRDIGNTFKGLFAVLDIVKQAFSALWRAITPAGSMVGDLLTGVLGLTGSFGEFLVNLDETIRKSDIFYKGIKTVVDFVKGAVTTVADFAAMIGSSLGFPGIDEATASVSAFLGTLKEKVGAPGIEKLRDIFDALCTRARWVKDTVAGMKDGIVDSMGKIDGAVSGNKFVQVLTGIGALVIQVASAIGDLLGKAIDGFITTLGNADFNGILDFLNALAAGGLIAAIRKFLDPMEDMEKTFSGFVDWVKGLGGGVTKILDGVRGSLEAWQTKLKSDALGKIAASIAVLSISLLVLASIDSDKVTGSLAAMGVMFAELMTSMAVLDKLSIDGNSAKKTASAMIKMSAALLVLSLAMKNLGELEPEQLAAGLVGVGVLLAEIDIFLNTAKFDKNASKAATGMILFAAAIKILSSSVKTLGSMDWGEMAKGLVGVGILLKEVEVFLNNAKLNGKAVLTATGIVILGSAIKILASACKDFGGMSWGELTKGLASIAALLLEITAFTKLAGDAKHVISTGLALIEISAAMKIFASAMSDFGNMSGEQIAKGLAAMGGALAEVAIAVNLMPKNMVGVGAGLVIVGAALKIVASALGSMGNMSWEGIAKGLVAMGGALAELAIGLNLMNGTLAGSAALLVAAGALAVLTPVLAILGTMSWDSIAKGLITIAGAFAVIGVAGAVLGPLAPAILALSGALALIGVSAVAIGAGLTLIGAGLTSIAVGLTSLATAFAANGVLIIGGLSAIVLGFAGLIPAIAEKLGEAIVVFAGVIAEGAPAIGEAVKALILTFVDVMTECAPAVANGALALVTEALSALATYTPQIVDSLMQFLIGLLDGLAQNMPELVQAAIDLLMSFFAGITDALSGMDTDTLLKGIVGIGLLSAVMVALNGVASLVPGAMVGILGVGAVIAEIALVLAAVGALAQLPGLSWLIGEGGKLLGNIGTAIGSFFGGIAGGFMSGVSSQFPQIGADLSAFMTNVQPFIDGASSISPDMLTGVKALTEALLLLTAADILNGLTAWITGGSSLTDFAEQLVPFGKALSSFSKSVSGVNASAVSNSATAGKALVNLANTVPKCGGLVGFFTGNRNMAEFGDNLVLFGADLADYANAVRNVNPDTVTASANAASALSSLADGLPDSSVFDKWFGGDQTLASFGKEVAKFGEEMGRFYSHISGADPAKLSGVITQVQSLADLAKSVKGIEKNAFDNFGSSLAGLADTNLTEFTKTFADSAPKINRAILDMLNAVSSAISKNSTVANPSMEKVMLSLAGVVQSKASAVNAAASQMMSGLSATIRSSGSSVSAAMNSVLTNALNSSKSSFAAAGQNVSQGFTNGIRSGMGSVNTAGYGLGRAALNSAKKALDSHSPSKEFIAVGEDSGKGMEIGLENSAAGVASAASKMADEAIKASEKGIDAFRNWIDERQSYGALSLDAEMAGWEHLQAKYKAGSEERKQIDREVFQLRKELSSEAYQASMDWIEEEKYYSRMSLADELAAYKRVQSRYAKGTDERKKMDREVYRLEKEIYEAQKQYTEDIQRVQSEANQKRLDLEEEYADKVRSVNERLEQDIQSLNDQYQNAVESRANSLYRSYNLFDAVKKREEVSGETLMKNLEGQVQEFGAWQDILDQLSARGLDSGLISELEQMGPDAISEIKALNAMSDSELEKYAALWSIKHAQAREQAVNELEDLRLETQDNIAQLRIKADEELDEYRAVWQQKMRQVTEEANEELEQLRKDFSGKIGIIKTDTAKDLQAMAQTSQAVLRDAGWNEIGQQIVTGMTEGVNSQRSGFVDALTSMALAGVEAVKTTLDIHSPSGVFRELGNFTGLGFVNALRSFAAKTYAAGSEMAESAKSGLSNALQTVSDIVANGIDEEPVIRPVLDLSNVASGAQALGSMLGGPQWTLALAGQASAAFSADASRGRMEVSVDNHGVISELRSLRGDMSVLADKIERMQIVLNTGALVGELAKPMDAALGQIAAYKGRGN